MKKGIFISLLAFILAFPSQSYCDADNNGSPFVFSDWLVWRVREGSAENWAQNITPAGTYQTNNLIDAPFKWNNGFRIGIGYISPAETWDTVLYVTSFQTNAVNQISGNVYSAFLGNFFANNTNGSSFGPFYSSANILWDFNFHSVDLELGRTFKTKQMLSLHPFLGLKTAFINQTINTQWQNPSTTFLGIQIPITSFSTATENLKNNFWGVGPSIGLNMKWPLLQFQKNGLGIFGDFSGALLWGHWNFNDLYQNNTPASIAINVSNINGMAPMMRGLLGFEWTHDLTSKLNLKVRLSYEEQVWFNQMQYYSYNMGRLNNLMSLQGGNLEFILSF